MPKGGTLHVEVRRARLGAGRSPLHAWSSRIVRQRGAERHRRGDGRADVWLGVFEPFFTTKPVGVGTGLGMSMAYGLVKQHRGYLHIYSEVGQGTTAKVYFPALRDQGMSEVETPDEGLPGGTEAILLVEDDQTMRVAAQQLSRSRLPGVHGRRREQDSTPFASHRARQSSTTS